MASDNLRERTGDPLSEVLDLVDVSGVLTGGFALRGSWATARTPLNDRLKFLAVVSGGARLTTEGVRDPLELGPRDVAILNSRSWARLESIRQDGSRHEITQDIGTGIADLIGAARDDGDVLIGGRIDLNPAGVALLSPTLPPASVIRASEEASAGVRRSLDQLFEELTTDRPGAMFAIRQYAQVLVLELLRSYLHQADLQPSWLRVSTDERLRPALALMHARPDRHPSVEELARAASMSRTSFAERFRSCAGMPPVAYLRRWRMLQAQRALRDGEQPVGALATRLGYSSESAFSTAFKRETGESPLRYRQRARTAQSSPSEIQ